MPACPPVSFAFIFTFCVPFSAVLFLAPSPSFTSRCIHLTYISPQRRSWAHFFPAIPDSHHKKPSITSVLKPWLVDSCGPKVSRFLSRYHTFGLLLAFSVDHSPKSLLLAPAGKTWRSSNSCSLRVNYQPLQFTSSRLTSSHSPPSRIGLNINSIHKI